MQTGGTWQFLYPSQSSSIDLNMFSKHRGCLDTRQKLFINQFGGDTFKFQHSALAFN